MKAVHFKEETDLYEVDKTRYVKTLLIRDNKDLVMEFVDDRIDYIFKANSVDGFYFTGPYYKTYPQETLEGEGHVKLYKNPVSDNEYFLIGKCVSHKGNYATGFWLAELVVDKIVEG